MRSGGLEVGIIDGLEVGVGGLAAAHPVGLGTRRRVAEVPLGVEGAHAARAGGGDRLPVGVVDQVAGGGGGSDHGRGLAEERTVSEPVGRRTRTAYAITEEFVSVYRLHPLLPDDYDVRDHRNGQRIEETEELLEVGGVAGDFVLRVDWRIKETPYLNPRVPVIKFDGTTTGAAMTTAQSASTPTIAKARLPAITSAPR